MNSGFLSFNPSSSFEKISSLSELKASASLCHTPRQFRALLDSLQTFFPFKNLICIWGYPSRKTIRYIFNHSFPIEFVRWYLTKGMLWQGPMFQEWLRTNKSQIGYEVRRRLKGQFDPEILERAKRSNLEGGLLGGIHTRDVWIFFAMIMGSEESCRAHLKQFDQILPVLAKTLRRCCPRPLLTKREAIVLERRTMGELIKQIAAAEKISQRTVRKHLQSIKRKLYTDDLVNAVVIAVRSGMLLHTVEKEPTSRVTSRKEP